MDSSERKVMVVAYSWPSMETTVVVGGCWPAMQAAMVVGWLLTSKEAIMVAGGCWPTMDAAMEVVAAGRQWRQSWWWVVSGVHWI